MTTISKEAVEAARAAYVKELPETALYPSEFAMRAAISAALPHLAKPVDGTIPDLIDRYWDLAYAEGKEGRTHDTESGDAQRTRHDLDRAIASLGAGTVAQEPVDTPHALGWWDYHGDIDHKYLPAIRSLKKALGQGGVYVHDDLLEVAFYAALSQIQGIAEGEPWGWVIPRGGKKKPVILDAANHDEISAICEAEIHENGYFPLYATPQPAAVAVPTQQAMTDHARGCEGRNYTCTCGYDEQRAVAVPEVAVKALEWREAAVPPAGEVLAGSPAGLYCIQLGWGNRFPLRFRDSVTLGEFKTLEEAQAAAQADYETRIRAALTAAPSPASETAPKVVEDWRDMSEAPKDGKHCILAVKEGPFVYSVQGSFQNGQWNAVHRDNVDPLYWMPNIRLPSDWIERAALASQEKKG